MSEPGTVSGTIYDYFNYPNTVANATITVTQDGVVINITTANTAGVYSIADLAPGLYTITASAPGYNDQTFSPVQILSGQATTRNFALA